MVKLKSKNKSKPKKKVVNTCILIDSSGSMGGYTKQVIDLLNSQIKSICSTKEVNTLLSISDFNTESNEICNSVDPNTVEIDENTYTPAGFTALNDAMSLVLDPKSTGLHELIIITDGEENKSKTTREEIRRLIKNCVDTDRWTIGFCCPPGYKNSINNYYNIPLGSITEWERTNKGINDLTIRLKSARTNYSKAIASGQSNVTRSYFTPDLDLTVKSVKATLDNVTSQFHIKKVTTKDNLTASQFVTDKNLKFVVGCLYYQLTKKETLQDYKNIVLQKNSDKTLYSGEEVRNILSIPEGGTIQINPSFSADWTVYVRSTSWNRKLVPGTNVLIKK